jgi:XTP/dITP diphosphohydrolase
VDEDQTTFEGNAEKKARAAASATGLPALADDSGLSVDALDGRPGLLSARYRSGSDEDRTKALLEEMKGVPTGRRGAVFRCALYLALPSSTGVLEVGECRGEIAVAPVGTSGFGYDPIFVVPSLGRTFAELTPEEKNQYSHRAQAFARMQPHLTRLLRDGA